MACAALLIAAVRAKIWPPTDRCFINPCLNGGTCNNYHYKYTCSCRSGFTGYNCQTGEEIKY